MADDGSGKGLAGVGAQWLGAAALSGCKGYAAGPIGQIHYRAVGGGSTTPILLIHQTPIGLAEYVDIQPALAELGRRSIACDNPGYGMSDPPVGPLTVADLADNLIGLIDHLSVDRVIVAGHYTGSAIAAAFAARHPARTAAVVLHGCPLYTAEERADRLGRAQAAIVLAPDGSHMSTAFKDVFAHLGPNADNLSGATWATLGKFLAAAPSETYSAIYRNDMSLDVRNIRAPGLILSDTRGALHDNDRRVAAMRPDFMFRDFSASGSFALMSAPRHWAEIVATFARDHKL